MHLQSRRPILIFPWLIVVAIGATLICVSDPSAELHNSGIGILLLGSVGFTIRMCRYYSAVVWYRHETSKCASAKISLKQFKMFSYFAPEKWKVVKGVNYSLFAEDDWRPNGLICYKLSQVYVTPVYFRLNYHNFKKLYYANLLDACKEEVDNNNRRVRNKTIKDSNIALKAYEAISEDIAKHELFSPEH